MFIVISSGHGKYIRGAAGPSPWGLDEVNEARKVVDRVGDILETMDVEVTTYHDDVSNDQSENLNRIVDYHNAQGRHDLDVSVHFNAYNTSAHGTECLYVSQETLSGVVATAISKAGNFTNRGPKYRNDLFFLGNTNAPAILIETCFCDHHGDCDSYRANFEAICTAIAESISGRKVTEPPPPGEVEEVPPPSTTARPTIGRGDTGPDVVTVQTCLEVDPIDGDFGPITERAVQAYQIAEDLEADGIVGPQTWAALEEDFELPPPTPPPGALEPLPQAQFDAIIKAAEDSPAGDIQWRDRGYSPIGYDKGMAIAWSNVVRKFMRGDSTAVDPAQANTGNDSVDAISWYNSNFKSVGMDNSRDGIDTLRHLFVLLWGLGMRESSGSIAAAEIKAPRTLTA